MKSKTFVMMFVAIGCGLVAAYLTARITAKQAVPDSVTILVAKDKIKAGDMIKEPEKLFVPMDVAVGTTPNAVTSLEELKGKIVGKTLQPGQWCTADDLSSSFGIELPKGFYAMAVKVAPDTAASGFILPKSRVNVVATIKDKKRQDKSRVVTVLQNVLVLAVDTQAIRHDGEMAKQSINTALLAVKPADSQRLSLATSLAEGNIRLVLRANDDDTKVPLATLENLDMEQSYGVDGLADPAAPAAVKLAVAIKDIEPGQTIDDPAKFFAEKAFREAPEKAISFEDLATLKGKTIKHTLFKDGVATAKHFEGEVKVVAAKPAAPPVKKHTLFIQNGGAAPSATTYVNGVATGFDSKGPASGGPAGVEPEPVPAPEPATEPATEPAPRG